MSTNSADRGIVGRRVTSGAATPAINFATDSEPWMVDGLCAQADPEAFFPEKGRGDLVKMAKKVCSHCEVRTECLTYALEHEERFGVWGGKSERERRKLTAGDTAERICELDGCDNILSAHLTKRAKYCCASHTTAASNLRLGRHAPSGRGSGSAVLGTQIAELGVTALVIKNWARATGLTTAVTNRGLPTQKVVNAYAAAHPKEKTA